MKRLACIHGLLDECFLKRHSQRLSSYACGHRWILSDWQPPMHHSFWVVLCIVIFQIQSKNFDWRTVIVDFHTSRTVLCFTEFPTYSLTNFMLYLQTRKVFQRYALCSELQFFSMLSVSEGSTEMETSASERLWENGMTLIAGLELCRGGTAVAVALAWRTASLEAWKEVLFLMATVGCKLRISEPWLLGCVGLGVWPEKIG